MKNTKQKFSLTFHGGVGSVTGANFLLESPEGLRVLVDCGLFQGGKVCEEDNRADFPYDPSTIDFLLITHGHLDHVGRIPKLVKDGFRGQIISTPPTKDIAELIMTDSIGVMSKEAKRTGQDPFYSLADVEQTMSLWQTKDYYEKFTIGSLEVEQKNAGHILGSSIFAIEGFERRIFFTGDLGSSPAPLLGDVDSVVGADYLIMESVYGDREHEDRQHRREHLQRIIKETLNQGGTLMIPAFSIERTQQLLFEISGLMARSEIPLVPVFLDSPLAIAVTEVYRRYKNYLKESVEDLATERNIFHFPQLHLTKTTDESKAIASAPARKIIIAGSGMSNGGRIIHHEKMFLPDKKNTLLLVGYQAAGSLGRVLQDGVKVVKILGTEVPVAARIETISGYSAHADSAGLLNLVAEATESLQTVFTVMGEPKSSWALAQRINDYLGIKAIAPDPGQKVILD